MSLPSSFLVSNEIVLKTTICVVVVSYDIGLGLAPNSFGSFLSLCYMMMWNLFKISLFSQESILEEPKCLLKKSSFFIGLSADENSINLHHKESLINDCQLILLLILNEDGTLNVFLNTLNSLNNLFCSTINSVI